MSKIDGLSRRLERLRERSHVKNIRLPVRVYSEDGATLLYQTPGYEDQPRVSWKVYIGDPNDDGIDL